MIQRTGGPSGAARRRAGGRRAVWAPALLAALLRVPLAWGAAPPLEDPLSGESVALEPGGDAVVHVVFFATWCPPCVAELERLAQLEHRWAGRGYRLVLVAVQTRHTRERLAQFVSERHPPGRFLFDATGAFQDARSARELPLHLVFDTGGREVVRADALGPAVENALEELLAPQRRGRRP